MLSLPFAMKASGVLPFLAGIVVMGVINGYSFYLLGWCCKATGAASFGDLWAKVFGAKSAWVADLAVFLNNGLALLSYCVLIGDFLSKAFAGLLPGIPLLAQRGPDLVLVGLGLLLPLSLLRDLAPLRPSSMAGLAATWYGFMLLATDAWGKGGFTDSRGPVSMNMMPIRVDAFQSLALFSSAFMAHYNAPKFFSDLQDNTLSRWAALVAGAFGLALFTFIVFGFSGFAIFGFAVEGNVLKNYAGGTKVLLAWLGMGFSVTFTYPLVFNTFRESSAALLSVQDASSTSFRVPFTAAAVGLTVVGGTFLTNVAVVSGIKGAVMSAILAFVLPALMHLKLTDLGLSGPKQGSGNPTRLMRKFSYALILIGVTTGVLALLAMFVFPRTDFSHIVPETLGPRTQ